MFRSPRVELRPSLLRYASTLKIVVLLSLTVVQVKKGKAVASSVAGEEELVSDNELEYDEQASIDESEDSGSEFQISDDEVVEPEDDNASVVDEQLQAYAEALEEDGIDADEVVMDAVIKESLASARASNSGAGPSSSKKGSSAAEALRSAAAAAAERRRRDGATIDVDDYVAEDSEEDDLSVLSDSSEDTALAKGKAKAKAKGKGKAKASKKADKAKVMTVARHADDEKMNDELKERERWNDPMAQMLATKKSSSKGGKSKSSGKSYQGAFEPNRYGIRPGYRWDGVDRSIGFEKKWFEARNRQQNIKDLQYAWQMDE